MISCFSDRNSRLLVGAAEQRSGGKNEMRKKNPATMRRLSVMEKLLGTAGWFNGSVPQKIAKPKTIAQDLLAADHRNFFPEDGAFVNEGMEFPVLPTGVHVRGQFGQKFFIEIAPDEF